jgi:hypothetical protein
MEDTVMHWWGVDISICIGVIVMDWWCLDVSVYSGGVLLADE